MATTSADEQERIRRRLLRLAQAAMDSVSASRREFAVAVANVGHSVIRTMRPPWADHGAGGL